MELFLVPVYFISSILPTDSTSLSEELSDSSETFLDLYFPLVLFLELPFEFETEAPPLLALFLTFPLHTGAPLQCPATPQSKQDLFPCVAKQGPSRDLAQVLHLGVP